jgi:hypothetical protein
MTPLQPGTRVKHAMSTDEHDTYHGIVLERQETHRIDSTQTTYTVRWIKPSGDPSDGSTSHNRAELVEVEKEL